MNTPLTDCPAPASAEDAHVQTTLINFPLDRAAALPASSRIHLLGDPGMRALVGRANRIARSDVAVLIIGETGTGKEVFARYIHEHSGRKGPFVAINCGALSESLADAELFGHERGAYTGAVRAQPGWFETAQGGTLLLDEIGELTLPLQVKLLRVLQEREVTRVGSRSPVRVDVRIVAATNVDLKEAVAAKRFREDLFFRLNAASFLLPPLRERTVDLESLAQHFLYRHAHDLGRKDLSLTDDALAALRVHPWPGNIRELDNVIHSAVLLAPGPRIEAAHLELDAARPGSDRGEEALDDALERLFRASIGRSEPDLFHRAVRTLVQSAFDAASGNQVHAAESLGISRHALRTQLSHLGIIRARRRAEKRGERAGEAGSHARPPRELRVGYQKFGTLSLVKAERALERAVPLQGVRISWTLFSAGPQLLEALHSGAIDFGTTGEVPPIFAQANGAPLVYVGHEPPSPGGEALVVRCGSDIREVADVHGRTVALGMGSNVHYLLVQCLEAHGLSLDDIRPVYLSPQDALAALEKGAVDAWVAWDPFLTVAQKTHDVRVLRDGTGLVSNYQFHLASTELAERHPEIIRVVLEELRRVGRSAVSNPARVAHGASSELGIDASSLEIAIRRLTHGARPLDADVIREQQRIADRFYALGLIPRAVSVRRAVWCPTG